MLLAIYTHQGTYATFDNRNGFFLTTFPDMKDTFQPVTLIPKLTFTTNKFISKLSKIKRKRDGE